MTATWLRALHSCASPILAFLLVVLTPVGTGQGVHSDQILDPVFPHLHFLGGVAARQLLRLPVPPAPETPTGGQALGASAGAAEAGLSVGYAPVDPDRLAQLVHDGLVWRAVPDNTVPIGATADPPPDPPPTEAFGPEPELER